MAVIFKSLPLVTPTRGVGGVSPDLFYDLACVKRFS